jgi:poly(3-hydroxybutyrate) depolymerase
MLSLATLNHGATGLVTLLLLAACGGGDSTAPPPISAPSPSPAPAPAPVLNQALTNTTLRVNQVWSQELAGFNRTADVLVPAGSGLHPVVIMLHGNGGNSSFINSMSQTLNSAIRVAPNGYRASWNVDNEVSKAPDVAFIRDLIAQLKTFSNVDATRISIYGVSNGAGMTNRLLIELDGIAFQRAATRVSQKITKMYRDGSFWFNATGNNNYDQRIVPATGRRIISISGTADPLIPYTGGAGVGTTFMDAQESIYRFAQAIGETGPQLSDAAGVPGNLNDADQTNNYSSVFVRYSYRNGQVVHYKLIGGDHGLAVGGSNTFSLEADRIIAAFLLQQ